MLNTIHTICKLVSWNVFGSWYYLFISLLSVTCNDAWLITNSHKTYQLMKYFPSCDSHCDFLFMYMISWFHLMILFNVSARVWRFCAVVGSCYSQHFHLYMYFVWAAFWDGPLGHLIEWSRSVSLPFLMCCDACLKTVAVIPLVSSLEQPLTWP